MHLPERNSTPFMVFWSTMFGLRHLLARPPPIEGLSNELLFLVTSNLDPPSLTCMALTSHRYYDFIRNRHRCRLSNLCPKFADNQSRSGRHLTEPYKKLIKQLRSWIPDRYIYCEFERKCYVLKWVCDCVECERRERRVRERAKNKREREKNNREQEKHDEWRRARAQLKSKARLWKLLLVLVFLASGWIAGFISAQVLLSAH